MAVQHVEITTAEQQSVHNDLHIALSFIIQG